MSDPLHPGPEIAGALARFWAGGAGPSHSSLSSAFALAGYSESEPDASANKEQRALNAVRKADQETARVLVEELLTTLRSAGVFDHGAMEPRTQALRSAFGRRGFDLSVEGFVSWGPREDDIAANEDRSAARIVQPTPAPVGPTETVVPSTDLLVSSLRRLPDALRPFVVRRRSRSGLTFNDEYDLQDAVEMLLRTLFNDVRPEERTPSYAGASSVMDFLLRDERTAVEVKVTSPGRYERHIKNELLPDIVDYQEHSRVRDLIVVVYDLHSTLRNPRGFEQDLSGIHGNLNVTVIVVGWPVPPTR